MIDCCHTVQYNDYHCALIVSSDDEPYAYRITEHVLVRMEISS